MKNDVVFNEKPQKPKTPSRSNTESQTSPKKQKTPQKQQIPNFENDTVIHVSPQKQQQPVITQQKQSAPKQSAIPKPKKQLLKHVRPGILDRDEPSLELIENMSELDYMHRMSRLKQVRELCYEYINKLAEASEKDNDKFTDAEYQELTDKYNKWNEIMESISAKMLEIFPYLVKENPKVKPEIIAKTYDIDISNYSPIPPSPKSEYSEYSEEQSPARSIDFENEIEETPEELKGMIDETASLLSRLNTELKAAHTKSKQDEINREIRAARGRYSTYKTKYFNLTHQYYEGIVKKEQKASRIPQTSRTSSRLSTTSSRK